MHKVRLGVIGLGNIGKHHADYLANGRVANTELAAICSSSPEKRQQYARIRVFEKPVDLISSGTVDAVLIATPHYQHTELGIAAFKAGLHVMVEKPIAVHKADAELLIREHTLHPSLVFAAMFQFRAEPRYIEMKRLIESGRLGHLLRINWIMTDWFRTEAYYSSSAWRATWAGEGGGVLLNQCLHNLDALQWLVGMPQSIRGFCRFGAHHDIEVEDDVAVFMEYQNGATGNLVTSTGESPGTNRLEIAGTRGRLLLENERLLFAENKEDTAEFSRRAHLGFARPESQTHEIAFATIQHSHAALTQNFVNCILKREPLIAPGEEGIHSVELANAILFSSLKKETVRLPLDSSSYRQMLETLVASSNRKAKVVKIVQEDISSSFRK